MEELVCSGDGSGAGMESPEKKSHIVSYAGKTNRHELYPSLVVDNIWVKGARSPLPKHTNTSIRSCLGEDFLAGCRQTNNSTTKPILMQLSNHVDLPINVQFSSLQKWGLTFGLIKLMFVLLPFSIGP